MKKIATFIISLSLFAPIWIAISLIDVLSKSIFYNHVVVPSQDPFYRTTDSIAREIANTRFHPLGVIVTIALVVCGWIYLIIPYLLSSVF